MRWGDAGQVQQERDNGAGDPPTIVAHDAVYHAVVDAIHPQAREGDGVASTPEHTPRP
jgi:hypothetical protein